MGGTTGVVASTESADCLEHGVDSLNQGGGGGYQGRGFDRCQMPVSAAQTILVDDGPYGFGFACLSCLTLCLTGGFGFYGLSGLESQVQGVWGLLYFMGLLVPTKGKSSPHSFHGYLGKGPSCSGSAEVRDLPAQPEKGKICRIFFPSRQARPAHFSG